MKLILLELRLTYFTFSKILLSLQFKYNFTIIQAYAISSDDNKVVDRICDKIGHIVQMFSWDKNLIVKGL